MEVQVGATYLEGNLIIAIVIFDLAIPLLGIYPISILAHLQNCFNIKVFIIALFISKILEVISFLLKRIKEVMVLLTMKYYADKIKKEKPQYVAI